MEERIAKLEEQSMNMQLLLWRIEVSLENIERNITQSIAIKDIVTTHIEKHVNVEKRMDLLRLHFQELDAKQQAMNIKIATFSGAWAVIGFIINRLIW